ncbi:MAG: hypothetical protein J6X70_00130 [Muribaculaceae bacterium]|nr:hypothetical protein [Muribaculaceae bacterium]
MEEKREIRPALNRMEVGDLLVFPLTRTNTVRSTVALARTETGRDYRTKINRELNRLEVTRTA